MEKKIGTLEAHLESVSGQFQVSLYIWRGWLYVCRVFLTCSSVREEKELLAAGDGIICWQDLSPVSKQHSEVCCCLSHGSLEYCHSLGCTQSCRWKHSCFWVCAGTLHGQACGSAGPQELHPLWTTSSSSLGKHAERTGVINSGQQCQCLFLQPLDICCFF